jgi:beta-lactamase class D
MFKNVIMKFLLLPVSLISLFSCNPAKESSEKHGVAIPAKEVVRADFQQYMDSSKVSGAILIFDPQTATYYSNDFVRSKKGFLPASTFKIPNSIIALETGVVESDTTILKWDGKKRRLQVWEQDLSFRDAFHVSCVPCYQEIARKIGSGRMKSCLGTLKYGHMVFDSASIDLFWLEGESKISQFEQIDFLQRFYNSELPISQKTTTTMKRLMVIEENENYKLSGKTGWAIRNENNYGWFVGYFEKGNSVYFVATNIEPKDSFDMDLFPKIRSEITMAALKKSGVWE